MRLVFLSLSFFLLSACSFDSTVTPTPTEIPIILPQTPTPVAPNCNSIKSIPTPAAEDMSIFPPISEEDRVRGPDDAAVTIIEYADFQDPPSALLTGVLHELLDKYPDELRIVFRDFPLFGIVGHEKAGYAAHATHAAALQGKYWEMHDALFAKQAEWSPLSSREFEAWLKAEAVILDIDAAQLLADMERKEILKNVSEAYYDGYEMGLPGTPFVLLNGQIYTGLLNFDSLDQIIALIALGERQFTDCPPLVIDPEKEYLATLVTEKGEIVIQFYPDSAPIAVNNFIFLAQEGWYENITFHRVLSDYFAETGDPSGTGQGNPGYFFQNEIDPALSFDRPGVVAMKNVGADTNGSQFFITYDAVPSYDGKYTIFGQVLSGMEVLEQLSPRDQQFGESLPAGDFLLSVTILER